MTPQASILPAEVTVHGPDYLMGLIIGAAIVAPSFLAFLIVPKVLGGAWDLREPLKAICYLVGGPMIFAIYFVLYRSFELPKTSAIVVGSMMPWWPGILLRLSRLPRFIRFLMNQKEPFDEYLGAESEDPPTSAATVRPCVIPEKSEGPPKKRASLIARPICWIINKLFT